MTASRRFRKPQLIHTSPSRRETLALTPGLANHSEVDNSHPENLGDSVGHMASRQYERAQDVATDAIQETGDAIQRNPLSAIGIGFGVGFVFGLAMGGRR